MRQTLILVTGGADCNQSYFLSRQRLAVHRWWSLVHQPSKMARWDFLTTPHQNATAWSNWAFCGGLNTAPPKDVCILMPGTYEYGTLLGKGTLQM